MTALFGFDSKAIVDLALKKRGQKGGLDGSLPVPGTEHLCLNLHFTFLMLLGGIR